MNDDALDHAWLLHPTLDRLGEHRGQAERLEELWASPGAQLLVVDAAGRAAAGVDVSGSYDPRRDVLLGRSGEQVWFARRGELDEQAEAFDLRTPDLGAARTELLAAAAAVLAWHDGAAFCERCGSPSEMVHGGFQRRCTGCGRELFPRMDPAMITAVLDQDDRLLLAHQASWTEGRVSVLAGFLEAGESAEHAVVREVREESGLEVVAARFVASQPWPYPRSLMLGFVARVRGEVRVDGQEIAWARWYTREELDAALAEGLTMPGTASIAGRLIEGWRRHELPQP